MNIHIDAGLALRLDELRRLCIQLGGVAHAITLYPPRYEQVVDLVMDPHNRARNPRAVSRAELVQIVDMDEKPIYLEQADRIVNDPKAFRTILAARELMYAWILEQGHILAACPACGKTQEIDLAFFAVALRLPPWRVTDGEFIATPRLSDPEPPEPPLTRPYEERLVALRGLAPRPPAPPKAAHIDFILPSARTGLAEPDDALMGTIGDVLPDHEAKAWRTWAQPDREQPDERFHWRANQAGFRAALRLSVGLLDLRDGEGNLIDTTPEFVERMFLADVQFLDVLYTATHELAVETPPSGAEPRCTLRCACSQHFLPVR